jgi:hypothetical protein
MSDVFRNFRRYNYWSFILLGSDDRGFRNRWEKNSATISWKIDGYYEKYSTIQKGPGVSILQNSIIDFSSKKL